MALIRHKYTQYRRPILHTLHGGMFACVACASVYEINLTLFYSHSALNTRSSFGSQRERLEFRVRNAERSQTLLSLETSIERCFCAARHALGRDTFFFCSVLYSTTYIYSISISTRSGNAVACVLCTVHVAFCDPRNGIIPGKLSIAQ